MAYKHSDVYYHELKQKMTAKIILEVGDVSDEDDEKVMKAVDEVEKLGYGYDLCFYDNDGNQIEA